MPLGYLLATILGGTLLVASLLTGHHGASHELDHGHAHESGDQENAIAALVFSVRFWTYLLAIGGLTGLLLRLIAKTGEPWCALLALSVGSASGLFAQRILSVLGKQSGGVVESSELALRLGKMLLPASPGVSSRVRLTVNNQIVDLIAVTEDPQIAAREEVLVLEVKDGVAHVTRNLNPGEKS